MILTERTINEFEKRLIQLTTITSLTELPQWTDVDIVTANCLLIEYRKLQDKQTVSYKEQL